jgi:ABC-type branched-subunit amino acid transport system substrate-binding protein
VTVGDWLCARTPAAPSPLAERLHAALGARLSDDSAHAYDAVLAVAESLLAELLALDCAQRDRALDLLAVDALVTYAFEAAAESPDTLAARASSAMSEIARLAAPPSFA